MQPGSRFVGARGIGAAIVDAHLRQCVASAKSVETSLDAADTSVRATSAACDIGALESGVAPGPT
jgi:hypothetical protein